MGGSCVPYPKGRRNSLGDENECAPAKPAGFMCILKARTEDDQWDGWHISLHCYIWTSIVRDRRQRADMCVVCVEHIVLSREGFNASDSLKLAGLPVHVNDLILKFVGPRGLPELPVDSKRVILKFVSWASWW